MKPERRSRPLRNGVLVVLLALLAGVALLWLVDVVLDGMFLDWFTNYYMVSYWQYDPSLGGNILVYTVNWTAVKSLLTFLALAGCILLALGGYLLVYFTCRARASRETASITHILREFQENPDRLPQLAPQYAGIESQLSQIRSESLRQAQLLETEAQRKNDLITYLAHDLKTPLASVIGYLSLLDETPDLPVELRARYTGITLEKAYRLEQLINEFFEIVRFNLQSITVNYERLNLSLMLSQMADEFYPIVVPQGKEITVLSPQELTLWGDGDKLARVFNNVLKNAVAYSYPNTPIEIEARALKDKAVITFTNRGDPIPARKLETIFEKFYRLDSARSARTGGSGLGLAIAREIVNAHHGTITAASSVERTVFTVTLPLTSGKGT